MDKEITQGYTRERFRDLEPLLADENNKAYARYVSLSPITPLGITEVVLSGAQVLPNQPSTPVKRVVLVGVGAGFTYADDGTNPSASHGIPIPADVVLVYDNEVDLTTFKVYGTGTDLRVAYYG